MAAIVGASHVQVAQVQVPGAWPGFDKVAHFALFGLLATALCRVPRSEERRISLRTSLGAVAITAAFGVSDEIHQAFNPHRYFEYADMLADLLGAIVGVFAYTQWTAYRRLLERRVGPQGAAEASRSSPRAFET